MYQANPSRIFPRSGPAGFNTNSEAIKSKSVSLTSSAQANRAENSRLAAQNPSQGQGLERHLQYPSSEDHFLSAVVLRLETAELFRNRLPYSIKLRQNAPESEQIRNISYIPPPITASPLAANSTPYLHSEVTNKEESKKEEANDQTSSELQAKKIVLKDLKILLIGPQQAGKSTFINSLYMWRKKWGITDLQTGNKTMPIKSKYFEGGEKPDFPTQDDNSSRIAGGKCFNFKIDVATDRVQYRLHLIDTPGFEATDKVEENKRHLDLILDIVKKTKSLNAILLVMNGTDSTVHPSAKYIMDQLQQKIPTILSENLVVLLTNVNLVPRLDISKVLDFKIPSQRLYYYNNKMFDVKPSEFKTPANARDIKISFEDSILALYSMLKVISSLKAATTSKLAKIREAESSEGRIEPDKAII